MHRNGTEAMRYRSYFVERTSVFELNVSKVKKKNERMISFTEASTNSLERRSSRNIENLSNKNPSNRDM